MSAGISIIIPAYARPRLLRDTLQSIASLKLPPGIQAEVLVVADHRMAEALPIVDEVNSTRSIPFRHIPEYEPNASKARNHGMREAAFDHVAFFDDDVHVAPAWIEGYFEAVDKHSADCVVGPVSPIFEEPLPSYFTKMALQFITSPYTQKGETLKVVPPQAAHEICGCNFGMRKQVAMDLGGFNPRLGPSALAALAGGEDFDMGHRLVAAGKTVVYQPRCAVGHVISSQKLAKSWSRGRWYGYGAWLRFCFDKGGSKHNAMLKLQGILRMAKLAVLSLAMRITGRRALAFEKELLLLKEAGFLFGARNQ